jgi:energy-coupling factor transporter ATP-binding protein EcfA2
VTRKQSSPPAEERVVTVPSGIRIVGSQLRSTNLERDARDSEIPTLHIGLRILDTLERLAGALEAPGRTRAWSLTGPYGSGKSTLASLVTALLGPAGDRYDSALAQVRQENGRLADRIAAGREHVCGTDSDEGMLLAIASARQEPLLLTIRRAVHNAVDRRWPSDTDVPRNVSKALQRFNRPDSGSGDALAAFAALCAHSPVLLVIDEFGKTLEYLAGRGGAAETNADLYLLQELAEQGAGNGGLPLYLYTLQHLSFSDYASHSGSLQTREWAKIQGRFEDITFTPDVGDTIQLLRQCLDHSQVSKHARKTLAAYDNACQETWGQLGLDGVVNPEDGFFTDLYPLHPVTAIAAPMLAAQVGQHDRSLTGFLAGDEPNSVARFLATHASDEAVHASTVRLDQLYDYFLASGRTTILASANASRWIEIDAQLSEAHGLPSYDLTVLKTVALLNLIDSAGALRASQAMIMFALTDPTDSVSEEDSDRLDRALTALIDRGFLVYREFSDEYRVWRGTDIDLKARIEEIWNRSDDTQASLRVISRYLPSAVVAGRHSQLTGMLRYFTTVASDESTDTVTGPDLEDAEDGLLLFHLGSPASIPKIRSDKPVVVGTTAKAHLVMEAARHVYALEALLDDTEIVTDSVAKREVLERLSQATAELAARNNEAFSPMFADSQWHLVRPENSDYTGGSEEREKLGGRSFASIVSSACEAIFPSAPHIRNEMLGRDTLTSQGAKALRELMTAMVEHPFERYLGIEKYGPERAMYSGVLEYLGLHRMRTDELTPESDELVSFGFSEPDEDSPVYPAWVALSEALSNAEEQTGLDAVAKTLSAPPFGIKAGVVPLLVVTALMLRSEDIALFREGTYQPRLTTELTELIRSNPAMFTVRAAPTSSGQRRLVLDRLSEQLGIGAVRPTRSLRNPAVLNLTRALLDHYRVLSPHARKTTRISPEAQRVRAVLSFISDPVGLIFTELPTALGLPTIAGTEKTNKAAAERYATALANALRELSDVTPKLRDSAISAVAHAFRLPATLTGLRVGLAAAVTGFVNASLEADLRGFVQIATNSGIPDEDWLDRLIVRIAGDPLNNWSDVDADAFPRKAQHFADGVDRVSHLYDASLDAGTTTGAIPVQAQLVTVTSAAGRETRTLVRMPEDVRTSAAKLAREVLARAHAELGPDGGRILLAALAEQLSVLSEGSATMGNEHLEASV